MTPTASSTTRTTARRARRRLPPRRPGGQAFDLYVQKNVWPAAPPASPGPRRRRHRARSERPDAAHGAADLASSATSGKVDLTWAAATDDPASRRYNVYRWTAAPAGATYTPVHALIATVTGTTYVDTTSTMGTTYSYEVRAVDAATNVGPRSNDDDRGGAC